MGPDEPADAPRQLTGQTGSARYMAPEVARSRPYGTSAEVYSLCILLRHPYPNPSTNQGLLLRFSILLWHPNPNNNLILTLT